MSFIGYRISDARGSQPSPYGGCVSSASDDDTAGKVFY